MKRNLIAALAAAAIAALTLPAHAGNIIDEWAKVKAPPPPELKAVTVDPKTDALFIIDMVNEACNAKGRPRCVESIPAVQKLLEEARAKNVTVLYSLGTAGNHYVEQLAPKGTEPVVKSGADKFINTDLEKILKDKGITTLITVGTLANGGVMQTASAAALRGFKVVVPVDGISSPDETTLYTEQYAAWHLGKAPVLGGRVTLSKVDMIKF